MSTEYTCRPVCPYCGYTASDSWEWGNDEDGEHECGKCEKTYLWSRHVTVDWSTRRAEPTKETT